MDSDPKKNLENILNGVNGEKDVPEEYSISGEIKNGFFPDNDVEDDNNTKDDTSINENNSIKSEYNININNSDKQNDDRLFDTSDVQPDVLMKKWFYKTVGGLSYFLENIKNNKKYRFKFIIIVFVLIAIIIGYQILKPDRDKATGLILDKEYTLTKNEKKGVKFMIIENEISYNDYDDFEIITGYGLINKNSDTMDYCVCRVYLNDYSESCLIVGDFKEYPTIPLNDITSIDYEDDVDQAIKNALGDEIDKDDYKITYLSPYEIKEILGRNKD